MISTSTVRARVREIVGAGAMAVGLAVAVAAGAASGTGAPSSGRVYGEPVPFGSGSARVYLDLADGVPVELGVALTEAALEDLPDQHDPSGHVMPDGHRMFASILGMPERNPTPFRHVMLGWNPAGHEPPGTYDLPHFDFHFYTIEDSARLAIDPADAEEYARGEAHGLDERETPAGYVRTPASVPFMGAHLVDPASPEFNGRTFSTTLIYGAWDGRMIFVEPMVTRAFLQSRPDFSASYSVPESVPEAGFYPSRYRVRWDAETNEYRIALTGFTWRAGGGSATRWL